MKNADLKPVERVADGATGARFLCVVDHALGVQMKTD